MKGLPWKGSRPLIAVRGFKSHLLRQKIIIKKFLTSFGKDDILAKLSPRTAKKELTMILEN